MNTLAAGDIAPDFTLADQNGTPINLRQLQGKWVVIYFYPRALTPGCTVQACQLRDGRQELKRLGITALGISPDKVNVLKKFETAENLNFTLLSDADHATAENYGVWQEKSMYGRKYMGMTRSTFLVDPSGIIRQIWPKVDPKTHLDNILSWLNTNVSA